MGAEARLKELGIVLPGAEKPVANYVPYRLAGNMLYLPVRARAMKTTKISPASSASISASRRVTGAPG